jgi:hypothetical protein
MQLNKIDIYTPKKMRHRIFTHERIKAKKEAKELDKEKRQQMMAPNAVEKLQRIKRAQASHKNQ